MNQKFIISREEDNKIVLRELSELEPGMFQTLYTEEYENGVLSSKMKIDELISIFRNKSFYPPNDVAVAIARGLKEFLTSDEEKKEIPFNDKDLILNNQIEYEDDEIDVSVDVEIDELLSDEDLMSEDDDDDLKDLKVTDIDDEK